MAQIISASIDITKITKSKTKEVKKKDGSIAKYLDISIVVNDLEDQFGNICSISEGQTKDERESKATKNYLGNGKRVWSDNAPVAQRQAEPTIQKPVSQVPNFTSYDSLTDDLAF